MSNKTSRHWIDKQGFNLVRKAIIESIARGIKGDFLGDNIRLGESVPYSDGYKSPYVGDILVNFHIVVKIGDSELERQRTLMKEMNNLDSPKLCPSVFGVSPISKGRHAMLLERLIDYSSLYSIIYEGEEVNNVQNLGKSLFKRLERYYSKSMTNCSSGKDYVNPYMNRIREKLKKAQEGKFGYLLRFKKIIVNGQNFSHPESILDFLECLPNKYRLFHFQHLIHGDPHLGNIMIKKLPKRGYSIKFIDPNPDWGKSDYLYDIGKIYHWAEEIGYINYEDRARRDEKNRKAIKARSRVSNDTLYITWYLLTNNEVETVERRRKQFIETLDRWAQCMANSVEDQEAKWRLHLSIASAHAGMLPIVRTKSHFLLAYAKMIEHLELARTYLKSRMNKGGIHSQKVIHRLRLGRQFESLIKDDWKTAVSQGLVSQKYVRKPSGRKGYIDIYVNDSDDYGVVVEVKHSDWDSMTEERVKRNITRQISQIWNYIESVLGQGKDVTPGVIFPKRPKDPKRKHFIEQKFEKRGITVVWQDEPIYMGTNKQ